jgi:hypothetical protein
MYIRTSYTYHVGHALLYCIPTQGWEDLLILLRGAHRKRAHGNSLSKQSSHRKTFEADLTSVRRKYVCSTSGVNVCCSVQRLVAPQTTIEYPKSDLFSVKTLQSGRRCVLAHWLLL